MRGAGLGLSLAAVLALGTTACRALPTTDATRVALQTVGYEVISLQPHLGPGGSRLDVQVAAPTGEADETGKVAGVVWTTAPFRFDHLDVTVEGRRGPLRKTFTYSELADRYGPRLEELDRRDYGREAGRLTSLLLAGVALPGVVLMGGFGVLVLSAAQRRTPGPRSSGARPRPS